MAKYIGPKTKIARKFGEAIYGEDRSFEKRNYPPGQHGMARRRAKRSEYATQLQEKQKAKCTYGILERQFRNIFERAQRASGITGEILLQLCESRLDNVVYRLGIAPTPGSRSSAGRTPPHHGKRRGGQHPFLLPEGGDKVAVREKSKSLEVVAASLAARKSYDWLQWNDETKEGTFVAVPDRVQIPENIKEQLIVELYSK